MHNFVVLNLGQSVPRCSELKWYYSGIAIHRGYPPSEIASDASFPIMLFVGSNIISDPIRVPDDPTPLEKETWGIFAKSGNYERIVSIYSLH